MEKKNIRVVAAVVTDGNRYLCTQRLRSRKLYKSEHWEFPGGKVEEGECDHEALIREIREEMGWDIFVGKQLAVVEHEYPDECITLVAYHCKGSEQPFTLYQHLDARWLTLEEMDELRWTDADRKIIEVLRTNDE